MKLSVEEENIAQEEANKHVLVVKELERRERIRNRVTEILQEKRTNKDIKLPEVANG